MDQLPGISHWVDILVIVVYLCVILGVGICSVFRAKRGSVQGYFLAGRQMRWFTVGASLFTSNIGSEHFVGLAGSGAAAGIVMTLFELFPAYLILLLGWIFIPVYTSAGVYTLPEYQAKRFGGNRIRIYLSAMALVLYIIANLSESMYSGALFINMALKWNMYLCIALLLLITGTYTIIGGLTTVMITDSFQMVILLFGSIVVMGISFNKIGGYQNLERRYFEAIPSIRDNQTMCGLPRQDAFHFFQDPVTGDQPWPGHVLQTTIASVWYWCCDQIMVQRVLAAKSLSHAKGGSLLAVTLKIFPLFLMTFPGMISRILFPDEVACIDPNICDEVCGNPSGCSNIAYPKLVLEILPTGVRGLVIAVMLSAIMSSLTSILNSASTLFTMDLWRRGRPSASQRELLITGRVFIVFMCGAAVAWVPMIRAFRSGRLFSYMNAVRGYLGSPISILFLISIFWKRATEKGAFFGIVLGQLCGVTRLIVELVYPAPPCGEDDSRTPFLSKIHYTYFCQMQLLFTALMIVIISLATEPRSQKELEGVTWWTKYQADPRDGKVNDKKEDNEDKDLECLSDPDADKGNHSDKNEDQEIEKGPTVVTDYKSVWQTMMNRFLGHRADVKVMLFEVKDTQRFLTQDPLAARCLNIFAVILMTSLAFIVGFYA